MHVFGGKGEAGRAGSRQHARMCVPYFGAEGHLCLVRMHECWAECRQGRGVGGGGGKQLPARENSHQMPVPSSSYLLLTLCFLPVTVCLPSLPPAVPSPFLLL
jgi:hypothetical protein